MRLIPLHLALALAAAGAAPAFADDEHGRDGRRFGPVRCLAYDGLGDDLLSAGLGKTGLQGAAPAVAVAAAPTAAELRRLAIYNNYRALADMTTNGGYGVLYGPNIDAAGNPTLGEGKVAGEECLAYSDDGSGRRNVTMMVQIPASFDPAEACIVAAPSSGSRGVYGAIGTAGEWGLKRGCAVAYTDKGSGLGAHDLQNDTVNLIDGLRAPAAAAGKASNFTAHVDAARLAAFNAASPDRFAFKHAHSQQNPEADWAGDVLDAVRFAFQLLNERHGDKNKHGRVIRDRLTKANTLVIASSVSNGGGASLRAAEADKEGLIDGVAVAEPNVQPGHPGRLRVERGAAPVASLGRPLYDYFTLANLFQPCATRAPSLAASPFGFLVNAALATNRCAALAARGLVSGATPAEQGESALAVLRASGWEAESDLLHASHYALATLPVTLTYANAYGRFSVLDNACGFSFGATDPVAASPGFATPIAASAVAVAQIFGNANGIPPTVGINIINNDSLGGPRLDAVSVSADGALNLNIDGALCLRALATGSDPVTGARLAGQARADAEQVRHGIRKVLAGGELGGKPAIIVHGRSDTLVPVNHSSRPYVAANGAAEGGKSRLRYYEVQNAQHFDAFLPLAGYDTRLLPLHRYFLQAMDLMYAHLRHGAALPASQVVRTLPRGGVPGLAPAITPANVPPIAAVPAPADAIAVGAGVIRVPD